MSLTSEQKNHTSDPFFGKKFSLFEWIGAALALFLCFHFLSIRIHAAGLPGGDEGSWLSVAAELSRGHGFTTRWLEQHFLTPYTLPRPDDFRYPALTSLIAIVFKIFGISIAAGRWTVAAIYLIFSVAVFLVTRSAFGKRVSMATLWIMAVSLFQLEWNSIVYTEGLFGLSVALLAAWYWYGEKTEPSPYLKITWWIILGALTGVTYLVRSNGILFLPGIFGLYYWINLKRKQNKISIVKPILSVIGFLFITGPWLIRSTFYFGSPFHVAGSAGMLRDNGQSHTLTVSQFLAMHPPLYPFERMAVGFWNFFSTLHFFEHGLEVVPLLMVLVAAYGRKSFLSPGLLFGFVLTFMASVYVSFDSWAGLRYMSSLMPFIYAYGLSQLFIFIDKQMLRLKSVSPLSIFSQRYAPLIVIALLLATVIGPHRFYERKYSLPIAPYSQNLNEHFTRLGRLVPDNENYYALSICKVNFLIENKNCVGLQELYDTTWFTRSYAKFHPQILILTPDEINDTAMIHAREKMKRSGFNTDTLEIGPLAVYLKLNPVTEK